MRTPQGRPEWSPFPRSEWPGARSAAAFTWPTEFEPFASEEPDLVLGAELYFHLVEVRKWVHRRVERVRFEGTRTARRRVSVDFNLPLRETSDPQDDVALIPVAILLKDGVADFDMRDERGASIPVLTRYQNQFAALSMLKAVALSILDPRPLPDGVGLQLARLCYGDSDAGAEALATLAGCNDPAAGKLMGNRLFRGLCETLASKFLLLVPLQRGRSERRVLRFSYAEGVEDRSKLGDRIAWHPIVTHLDIPSLDDAGSYHLEVQIPDGLEAAPIRAAAAPGARRRWWRRRESGPPRERPLGSDPRQGLVVRAIEG